jgi:hypothetical protein
VVGIAHYRRFVQCRSQTPSKINYLDRADVSDEEELVEGDNVFGLPVPRTFQGMRTNTKYRPELVEEILWKLSEGIPMLRIMRDMPVDRRTIYYWRTRYPEVDQAIRLAREYGEETIADECLEIVDNLQEHPDSRRIRVWTRLQLLEKWNPKRWGPKQQVEHRHDFTKALEDARARVVSNQ